jgi:hypothetical protein
MNSYFFGLNKIKTFVEAPLIGKIAFIISMAIIIGLIAITVNF